MTPTVVVVSLVAMLLAFRAGSSWRHHRRTWSDHKTAVAATKKLAKTRWSVLRLALLALLALILYEGAVTVAAAVANVGDIVHGPKPATPASTGPTAGPSTKASSTKAPSTKAPSGAPSHR